MRGVPFGCRIIARNWYSVLNASIARIFPEKSSSLRGSRMTTSERLMPIRCAMPAGAEKLFPLHLGRSDPAGERLLAESRFGHVPNLRGVPYETHIDSGLISLNPFLP